MLESMVSTIVQLVPQFLTLVIGVAIAFTLLAVCGLTNAMNIIDGANGLASGCSVIMLCALGAIGIMAVSAIFGLVPLTLGEKELPRYVDLSGVGLPATVTVASGQAFTGGTLFTHRGLSGPAVLQISSYWQPGQALTLNLVPNLDLQLRLLPSLSQPCKLCLPCQC